MTNWNRDVYPVLIDQLKILNDQGITPTLRGMYYRLFSLQFFRDGPKDPYSYLSDWTGKLRKESVFSSQHARQLPIDCFSDDHRGIVKNFTDYKLPSEYITHGTNFFRSFPEDYRNNIYRWLEQPHYIEVWTEKVAMVGTLQPFLKQIHITVVPSSGYSSIPFMHRNMKRLERYMVNRFIFYILDVILFFYYFIFYFNHNQ